MIEEKDIPLIFRLSNEEDINKLAIWNNIIVKRIKILQISQTIPKAHVTEKKDEQQLNREINQV